MCEVHVGTVYHLMNRLFTAAEIHQRKPYHAQYTLDPTFIEQPVLAEYLT